MPLLGLLFVPSRKGVCLGSTVTVLHCFAVLRAAAG
jgi:hypothetical protein